MTCVPIDQAPAGPALDAAVAEARGWQILVMGSHAFWVTYGEGDRWSASGYLNTPLPDTPWEEDRLPPLYGEKGLWAPSTDIAAAWGLVELLIVDEVGISFLPYPHRNVDGAWWVGFATKFIVKADTAPLAITRAYLKAKGVEEVEVPTDG